MILLKPGLVEMSFSHQDFGTRSDKFIKSLHINGSHPNASITDRSSKERFLGCTMDIDTAAVGIPIVRLETIKPEDPGYDRITSRGIGSQHLASGLA
jgi:hypothetical protein